ncbi:putative efflux pump periplasmic linker TtgA precursor [compost metagenome]
MRSADIDKQFTTIKAPVSGYIGRIPKRVGNLVTKNDSQSLTVLSDVQEVYVYFSMSESDFLYFTKKQAKQDLKDSIYTASGKIRKLAFPEVSLLLADGEAYGRKGKVDAVNGQVNRTTGAISLRATFPNTDNILRTGSTGTLKFVETQKGVIQIPQVSTSELQDKTFVYVVDNKNIVHRRSVKIEGKSNSNYIISEGLAVGDRILLSGFDKISEGATIIPINKTK